MSHSRHFWKLGQFNDFGSTLKTTKKQSPLIFENKKKRKVTVKRNLDDNPRRNKLLREEILKHHFVTVS